MLQTHLLQKYAPNSLALLYRPIDTGSPGHDMSEHISRFKTHRTDIEETQLIGGRVIGHIEHDLGPADESELQHRILTIPYAEKSLDSNPNAVEFVRIVQRFFRSGQATHRPTRVVQILDDAATQFEGVLVVIGQMIGDPGAGRMHQPPAQFLSAEGLAEEPI